MKTKILAIVLAVLMFLFALTFSIALPIYVRPFYYAHIDVMRLDEISGKSKTQIIDAYDELLDYLTGNTPYGVGVFKSSPDGQSHFEDCKVSRFSNLNVFMSQTEEVLPKCLSDFSPGNH